MSSAAGILTAATLVLAWLYAAALWPAPASAQAPTPPSQAAQPSAEPPPPDRQKLVIVLSTHEPGLPEVATLLLGLREGLLGTRPGEFNIFVEHLDKSAAVGADDGTLRQLLGQKYSRTPDLVIALGADAVAFATRSRSRLWRTVPLIIVGSPGVVAQREPAGAVSGIAAAMEADRTLFTALRLFPETKRIALISGASPAERELRAEFLAAIAQYEGRISLLDLTGKPPEQVKDELAVLTQTDIVYFLSFRSDATGRSFQGPEVLELLAQGSPRPIFGTNVAVFGRGIIGGWLIDQGQLGREVAAQALQVLSGNPAAAGVIERSSSIRPMFDWRMLTRWGIGEDRLPAGSIVLYREPGLWERYRSWILGTLAAFALQAGLIGLLLFERTGRRRAEAQALKLSGDVIMAAERERARIAQELHDDVSQRLALLSIEIDQFGGRPAPPPTEARAATTALSAKTRQIADDIYQLARELHPSALRHMGLAAAVRGFCGEITSRHGLPITIEASEGLGDLPENIAISLYRIVQEALQNTIKHSHASAATVKLEQTVAGDGRTQVSVAITDDGDGIVVPETGGAGGRIGTGIFGMRERLRLIGGRLELLPNPGGGTIVRAHVPVPETAAEPATTEAAA